MDRIVFPAVNAAIARSGPIQGNVVDPYPNRRNRLQAVDYHHASLQHSLFYPD